MASKIKKPYIVSVAGMTPDDNILIIERLNCVDGVSAIELNLSCPNLIGKPQMAYDFRETDNFLYKICKDLKKPLGVKLPPYFDPVHFQKMSDILNNYPISFVTCINSIGNALVIDPHSETVVIKPKSGFGGIGGDFIKPTALANVRMFSKLLTCDISVIGCGGIKSGWDAFEHILCGASAVQIGTQLWKEGVKCFERISEELKLIMIEKGYNNINDFKGKLKEII
jgi:dihydroorotate dehydrogenase (fumarate)